MAQPVLFDSLGPLIAGMNSGTDPSLIAPNQCFASRDFTFRDGFAKTRPPFANVVLTFDTPAVAAMWNTTGRFQGASFYLAEFGQSGFIVSISGRLYRIQIGTPNTVTDITPSVAIVTTADFTVPAPAASVIILINVETPIDTGDTIFIDSGQYTVTNRATGTLTLTYIGGAANATAVAGTSVLDSSLVLITFDQVNPDFFDFVYLFQAENYMIVLADQHSPVIYDGAISRLAGIGEIPPGSIGVYAWGRIWIVLPNKRDFVAGDIVKGPSGTPAYAYRDAILKMSENDFLNEGGSFSVPSNAGQITAIQVLAAQDNSLGIGPVLVGTTLSVFSVNAPVDRTTWKNLTYPIQTVSLIDNGPVGPRNGTSFNGDWWYRANIGIRTFRVARREIDIWGNTPESNEIQPTILDYDTPELLYYGSHLFFDNKLFCTVSPQRTDSGVIHQGLAVVNFDLISGIQGKTPPAWEGATSGLNILQVLKGTFNGAQRAFAFALNGTKIELWEILKDGQGYYDQYTVTSEGNTTITRTSIKPFLETRSMDFGTPEVPKLLNMAEIYLDQLVDNVTIVVKFRPDQYPDWITWTTLRFCANVTQCTVEGPTGLVCSIFKTRARQYAARVLLPQPPETCNTIQAVPINVGHEFQFRFEGTGHFRIRRFRPHAIPQTQESEGDCPPETATCKTFPACETQWFGNYSSAP